MDGNTKEETAPTTAPVDSGAGTAGVGDANVNPEDIDLETMAAAKPAETAAKEPSKQATAAAKTPAAPKKAKTLQDYVNEGQKPPVEMVNSPAKFKEYLLCFPKVRVIAPLNQSEKKGVATETVSINGVSQTFLKGVFIDLPEPMAKIVMDHYEIGDTAHVQLDKSLGKNLENDKDTARELIK